MKDQQFNKERKGGGFTSPPKSQDSRIDERKYDELKDLSKVSASRIVEIAEEVGKHLKGIDVKINQIRRFLDETRQIETEAKTGNFPADRIILLRPKLAYSAGRQPKVKDLMNVLDPAIKSAAESKDNFQKFLRLIEGIVAYHRYYGGTN
jgi:CRISPR-associated protein Csm2